MRSDLLRPLLLAVRFVKNGAMHQVRSLGGRGAPKNSYRRLSVALERLEPSTPIRLSMPLRGRIRGVSSFDRDRDEQ